MYKHASTTQATLRLLLLRPRRHTRPLLRIHHHILLHDLGRLGRVQVVVGPSQQERQGLVARGLDGARRPEPEVQAGLHHTHLVDHLCEMAEVVRLSVCSGGGGWDVGIGIRRGLVG